MEAIRAFGKLVTREKAIEIIINDKVCEICYASCEGTLRDLLRFGWRSLEEWSDEELEDVISDLCEENQTEPISSRSES